MARKKILRRLAVTLTAVPLLLAAAPPGRLALAVAAQRDLVAEQPDSAAALNDLANLLVESGELEEAEAAYRQAMAIDASRPEPPFNLALLLAATDHQREAQRLLSKLLEDHPDHAWGHYQLGNLHQAKGDRGRALHSYREAFRLDPRLTDPRHNPHVLDNSLATAAMIEAFSMNASAVTSQRLYAEPSRITGLLLPRLTAEPEEAMEEPEEAMEEPEEPAEIEEVEPPPGEPAQEPAEEDPEG